MIKAQKIKLDYKKAKYRYWNKEKQKWFYLVPSNTSFPLNEFLIDEKGQDIYLALSLKDAPWIWGKKNVYN